MQEVKNYYAGRKGSPREVRNPDNSNEYILLVHLVLNYFRSSGKRETDIEITTFLPASDSLFGSRLIFKQNYLTVE